MKSVLSFYHTLRFWTLITVLSLGLGVIAIVAGLFDPSGNTPHKVASLWSRLLCRWNNIEVEIRGLENILKNQAQIFVANHQGYFDIFTLTGFLPVQIRWVAKSSLFRIPFVGWSMLSAGYIPVERNSSKKAYRAFLNTIETIKAGNSVVIFPEGTRSEDGTIGPFKKGGQLLAQRSGAPMVPVTLAGTWKILRKGSMILHPGPVKIIVSPAVTLDPSDPNKGEGTLESIRNTICENFDECLAGQKDRPREGAEET